MTSERLLTMEVVITERQAQALKLMAGNMSKTKVGAVMGMTEEPLPQIVHEGVGVMVQLFGAACECLSELDRQQRNQGRKTGYNLGVVCPKHGKVAETLEGTHLFRVFHTVYCPRCVHDGLHKLGISALGGVAIDKTDRQKEDEEDGIRG